MATRFQADRDLVIVPESQGSKLDPSNRDGVGAKMGLDATKPLAAPEMIFKRIRVPGEEAIDVAEILKRSAGADWRDGVEVARSSSGEATTVRARHTTSRARVPHRRASARHDRILRHEEIASRSAAAPSPAGLLRSISRTVITTYGRDSPWPLRCFTATACPA